MIIHTSDIRRIIYSHTISLFLSLSLLNGGKWLVGWFWGAVGTGDFVQILPIEVVNSMQQEVSHISRSFSRTENGNPNEPHRIAG